MITSPIRPSGSYQWVNCSGSIKMKELYPRNPTEPSVATDEGKACHWLSEQIINTYVMECEQPIRTELVGTTAPDNVLIDDDMWDGAMVYVDAILDRMGDTTTCQQLNVEQQVNLDNIYPSMSGTPDCWWYDAYAMTLHVFDLKYGMGLVEAYNNPQLLIYASGIIANYLHPSVANDERLKVHLTIVQPRAFHELGPVRTWKIKALDMRPTIITLEAAAHKAMGDDADLHSGRHCKYCSAKFNCRSLQQTVYNAIDVITDVSPIEMNEHSTACELTLLKYAADLIKYRLISVEQQANTVIHDGKLLKGWIQEPTFGRKKWKDDDQARALGEMMGIDLDKHALITPTQAKAVFKKAKLDNAVIDSYSTTPQSGMKLKIDDGSRLSMIFNNN